MTSHRATAQDQGASANAETGSYASHHAASGVDGPTGFDPARVKAAIESLTPAGRRFLAGVAASGRYVARGQTFGIGGRLERLKLSEGQSECGGYGCIRLTALGKAVQAAIATEARRAVNAEGGAVEDEGAGPKDIAQGDSA